MQLSSGQGGSGGEPDPRLAELREMGLGHRWLVLASAIGYDNFIIAWQILDDDEQWRQDSRGRIVVPRFSRFLRYQRNRYIKALSAEENASGKQIAKKVKAETGESLSEAHIHRLIREASMDE